MTLFKKPETEQGRIIRYADTIVLNSDYTGELDNSCLDVFKEIWEMGKPKKLIHPLDKIWNEVKILAPDNIYGNGTTKSDIAKDYAQKIFDDVLTHLLTYDYISIPKAPDLKWVLNETGKKMKQLKGHLKYQEYIDKQFKAEIAEMNGKIYWKRRAFVSAVIGLVVGILVSWIAIQLKLPKPL